jgi:hypothetical protein
MNEDEEILTYAVDIPDSNLSPNYEQVFINVGIFTTREEAIRFAQDHYGADENGTINLITKF